MLTNEQIESVLNALPIQARMMLKLLLLQYFEISQEDLDYLAADRPDPRFQSGYERTGRPVAREVAEDVTIRVAQYRKQVRQKREKFGLQMECLRNHMTVSETVVSLAEELLANRFGLDPEAIQALKKQARTVVPKPAIRELERKWERDEIPEDAYLKERLCIEYQTELRKLERQRKHFELAKREHRTVSIAPLQDHEVAHIWGIPAGSLAGRKVKALHQYLQGLQAALQKSDQAPAPTAGGPLDLWKQTLETLSLRPIERSVATYGAPDNKLAAEVYDALERTEAALVEKLTALASRTMPEDIEVRFWPSVAQSLFALQRLAAIQAETDTSHEALEQTLLSCVSPRPKVTEGTVQEETKPSEVQLSEMGEHILRSFIGEDISK